MISVIVPVFNEESGISSSLVSIEKSLDNFIKYEIIVVNDGSTDGTAEKIKQCGVKNLIVINHIENLGYGKSLFDGIVSAKYNCIAIIDGDGSYPAESIKELYKYHPAYDMVVGARTGREYKRGVFKKPARILFQYLCEYAAGRKIPDVNSGLRIFKKDVVMKFQDSLCTGFSFTTTLTLLFLLNFYYVKYVPVGYLKREGDSKVKHFKDTLRAGQIIVQVILFYNPIKLFLLLAVGNATLGLGIGILNKLIFKSTLISMFCALCLASFIPIFCIGLIADQLKKIYNLNNKS
jgi:Glycosyltransferases involved in cell wall biogenesis